MEQKDFDIIINGKKNSWPQDEISGKELKELAGVPHYYSLWLKEPSKEREIYNEEKVHLTHGKVDVFFTKEEKREQKDYELIIDQKKKPWPKEEINGKELKELAGVPLDYGVWLKEPTKDIEIKNEEKVRLKHGQVDIFFTAKKNTTEG